MSACAIKPMADKMLAREGASVATDVRKGEPVSRLISAPTTRPEIDVARIVSEWLRKTAENPGLRRTALYVVKGQLSRDW